MVLSLKRIQGFLLLANIVVYILIEVHERMLAGKLSLPSVILNSLNNIELRNFVVYLATAI